MYKIDKTEVLEKRLEHYPSIFIEAAAASGKTTAVEMLVEKHLEINVNQYDMSHLQTGHELPSAIEELQIQNKNKRTWIVFENIPSKLDETIESAMAELVRKMPKNWKVIFISREQPSIILLDLFWKGLLDIVPQKELLFTLKEVQKFAAQFNSPLQAKSLHKSTGGWAGCVDTMLRMSKMPFYDRSYKNGKITVEELRGKYEVNAYIQREILDTLTEQERTIVDKSMTCPWFNTTICRNIWKLDNVGNTLEGLERKGILIGQPQQGSWSLAPLFNVFHEYEFPWKQKKVSDFQDITLEDNQMLAHWYEEHGYIREALWCMKSCGQEQAYFDMLLRHYDVVPFIDIPYEEVLRHKEDIPELHYLRGMCCHKYGDYKNMSAETKAIGKDHPLLYLNLAYANPMVSLDDWLLDVEKLTKKRDKIGETEKFRLFDILGNNHTYLCGVRDLTGMFACTKKEENRKASVWKRAFGENEWQAYCLARMDYYLETDREKVLHEEDEILLTQVTDADHLENGTTENWNHVLVGLYLLCRQQVIAAEEERKNKIYQLKDALISSGNAACINNAEAIVGVYSAVLGNPEQISCWLISVAGKTEAEMTHAEMLFQVKGYMLLQYYEKAEAPLQKILLYLNKHRMNYLYAEALFQQAIVNWHNELHGQALKNAIESFMISETGRYVSIYCYYGKNGMEVVKSYVEWMQNNAVGGWNTKKKYNYGNVLRMPFEDYLETVWRKTKRSTPKEKSHREPRVEERLTMMETIILQDISRGLTNADICVEQNLKLPTVKSHLYNMYKKLGVNTRVQAILKGKEMGIVK